MLFLRLRLFWGALALASTLLSPAQTPLSGDLSDATTGPLVGGVTYEVVGSIFVRQGDTLTISPGAVIKFRLGGSLSVSGTLLADGATFTGVSDDSVGADLSGPGVSVGVPGEWGRLTFSAGSDASILRNCTLQFGGRSSLATILIQSGTPRFEGVHVFDGLGDGFDFSRTALPVLVNCDVQRCRSAFVRVPINALPGFQGTTASGNTQRDIPVVTNGTTDRNLTLGPGNLPGGAVEIATTLVVPMGFDLTLGAGMVFKMSLGQSWRIDGNLRTLPGTPTILTSDTDDTAAGDTNKDGTTTVPTRGLWTALRFSDTADSSVVEDLELRYCGRSGAPSIELQSADVTLRRVAVQDCIGPCLSLSANSFPTVTDCRFDRGSYPVFNAPLSALAGFSNCQGSGHQVGNHIHYSSAILTQNLVIRRDRLINDALVTSSATVGAGVTLTLEEGVIWKFNLGGSIDVDGTLLVQGTAAAPVVFTSLKDDAAGGDTNADGTATSPSSADWTWLRIRTGGTGSMLQHFELRYAGRSGLPAVSLNNVNPTIRDGVIRDAGGDSISLNGNSFPAIIDCQLLNGGGKAMDDVPLEAIAGLQGNTATGHGGGDTIYVRQAPFAGVLTIMPDNLLNNEFVLTGTTRIEASAVLTLTAGVVVKMSLGAAFDVFGQLETQGAPGAPVVFTSVHDDSFGTDSAGNGAATMPALGDWTRMAFQVGSDASRLQGALLRYAGRSNLPALSVSSDVTMLDSVFELTLGDVMQIDLNAARPTVVSCRFDGGDFAIDGVPAEAVAGFRHIEASGNRNGDVMRLTTSTIVGTARIGPHNYPGDVLLTTSSINVALGAQLIIEEGTQIKFPTGGEVSVFGHAELQGSGALPIVLTSERDDSVGGDTNGDGNATVPVPGLVGRLWWQPGATGSARHVTIRYAGRSGLPSVGSSTLGPHFEAVRTEFSGGPGFSLADHVGPVRNLVVMDCGGAGIQMLGGQFDVVHATVVGAGTDGIRGLTGWVGQVWNSISWDSGANNFSGIAPGDLHFCNGDSVAAGAQGNLNVNPEFLDRPFGDLTLAFTSPMINAADLNVGLATLSDAREGPRTVDSRLTGMMLPDIGAYEFLPYLLNVVGTPRAGTTMYFEVVGLPGDGAIFVGPVDGTFVFAPYGIGLTGTLPSSGVLSADRVRTVVPVSIPDDPAIYGVEAAVQGVGLADMFYPRGTFTQVYRARITP